MKRKYHSGNTRNTSSKRSRRHTHSGHPTASSNRKPVNDTLLPFPHGNFQIDQWPADARLKCLRKEWFENRDVLDIGCNAGFMTLAIASVFRPSTIVGLDIDRHLIEVARKNLSICQQMVQEQKVRQRKDSDGGRSSSEYGIFPVSMIRLYGPVSAPSLSSSATSSTSLGFCRSITFKCENFVLESDEELEKTKPEFDTISAMNVTKWVHLNYGDDGLKRFFKRIHAQLRPNGYFVLDAQPWNLYKRNLKKLAWNQQSQTKLDLKPEMFKEYLLSDDVGFTACHVVTSDGNSAERSRRSLLLFEKGQK